MPKYVIRPIEPKDNKQVEDLIRSCLIEYGANHEGTAWTDPYLGRFSEVYTNELNRYWVAVDESGKVIAGTGIGEIPGADGVCELQKMYCYKQARGTGLAHELITIALDYAKSYYKSCYLETFKNMLAAQRFYEKHGFKRIYEPIGNTGHFSCDVLYLKDL